MRYVFDHPTWITPNRFLRAEIYGSNYPYHNQSRTPLIHYWDTLTQEADHLPHSLYNRRIWPDQFRQNLPLIEKGFPLFPREEYIYGRNLSITMEALAVLPEALPVSLSWLALYQYSPYIFSSALCIIKNELAVVKNSLHISKDSPAVAQKSIEHSLNCKIYKDVFNYPPSFERPPPAHP